MAADPVFRPHPARPFLKWAGGKSQLLGEFDCRLPRSDFGCQEMTRYVEPFVGGGAVFFYIKPKFPHIQSTICDINTELVLTYQVLRRSVDALIGELDTIEMEYRGKTGHRQE